MDDNNEKQYHGFYKGLVVQNNDPARAGRIKIFIPSIMSNVIEKEKLTNEDTKEYIDFKNLFSDGTDAFKDKKALTFLKNNLLWARQMSPLLGTGSGVTYRHQDNLNTTSDSNNREEFPDNKKMEGYPLSIPPFFQPGGHQGIEPAITGNKNLKDVPTIRTDLDNKSFAPELGSGQAKGIFSIPSVNAYVWVFFDGGDYDKPVYFGYDHSDDQWRGMYEADQKGHRGDSYPNIYENGKTDEIEKDSILLRNKIIFNFKSGRLLFDETDYKQRIQLSYRNGSNFEFDPTGYKLYVQGKGSELVNGNKFLTVNGDYIGRIKRNSNITIDKDLDLRVGSRNEETYREARRVYLDRSKMLHNFRKKRTAGPIQEPEDVDYYKPVPFNYLLGIHSPLDPGSEARIHNLSLYNSAANNKTNILLPGTPLYTPATFNRIYSSSASVRGQLAPTPDCSFTFANTHLGISETSRNMPAFLLDSYDGNIVSSDYNYNNSKFRVGLGDPRMPINAKSKSNKLYKQRHWLFKTNPKKSTGSPLAFNRKNRISRVDMRDQQNKSPASAGGIYEDNPKTSKEDRAQELVKLNIQLDKILAEDETGGDARFEVTRDAYFDVGVITNDFPAIRVDPEGGLVFAGVHTTASGGSNVYKSTPIYEETQNSSNIPVGNVGFNFGNSFSTTVGSGGITFKTTGVVECNGIATRLSGTHSLELTTGGNARLTAGRSLIISADTICMKQSNDMQLGIGGSMGIENNLTVAGSTILNGETYVQHITAPVEMQVTEQISNLQARTKSTEHVAYFPEGMVIGKLSTQDCQAIVAAAESGSGSVSIRAWTDTDGSAKLGEPPSYKYSMELDEYIIEPGTGYNDITDTNRSGDRRNSKLLNDDGLPTTSWKLQNDNWVQIAGKSSNSVPIFGTDRLTSIEVEMHSHQFKNLPLSLRTSHEDVCLEASDVESYADIKSIRKGNKHGKVLVKDYGDSERHKNIMKHLENSRDLKTTTSNEIKKAQLRGTALPSMMDEVQNKVNIS